MMLVEIACLVFACTAANHLGLIGKIEELWRPLPIVSCAKCLSFWSVLSYLLLTGANVITSLAISFLSAWSAVWLDLLMGFIDKLYLIIYDSIYTTANSADADT